MGLKNIQIAILFLSLVINCKAQNPILDISIQGLDDISGAYYKDTQNLLNPFVGTYIYTNGNTSLKIVLQKKIMSSNGVYFEDLIIGEYQYIENGIQKINTLGSLLINHANGTDYSIDGNFILTGKRLGCEECSETEKRLRIDLSDRSIKRTAELDIRRTTQNGQAAIKVVLWWTPDMRRKEGTPLPPPPKIPAGTYIMLKQ